MKIADAIAELARRQLELEQRVAALEALPSKATTPDEAIDLPVWTNARSTDEDEPLSITPAMRVEDGQVVFAPPTEDQRKLRSRLAPKLGFEHWRAQDAGVQSEGSQPLPVDVAERAYISGGPLWLYHYDRAFVMSLRPELRAAMVHDVELVDPTTAQEFGRDVLKGATEHNPGQAIDQDEAWRDAHGNTRGA